MPPRNHLTNIHALLLRRLLATAVALSALIGGGMLFWQMEKIDERVLELARQESDRLTAPFKRDGLLDARIFAIVDVFDALTSRRPYKEPMSLDEAMTIMARDSGRHFDPTIFEAFQGLAAELHQRISGRSEDQLAADLEQRMTGYFFADA